MDYLIYSYGGHGELISQVFNGIARIFYDGDSAYFTLVGKLSMTIGVIWAGSRAMFSGNIGVFAKSWFMPSFLSLTFLFAPKASVLIIDEAKGQQYAVDNVPLGVAILSSIPSKISHYLANTIEEQMRPVGPNKSTKTGVMFGAKLAGQMQNIKIKDPMLRENAKTFSMQCYLEPFIMGNIGGLRAEAEATPNILAWLGQNPARAFGMYYKMEDGSAPFKACGQAHALISEAVTKEANDTGFLGSIFSSLGGSEKTQEELSNRLIEDGSLALQSLGAGTSNLHEWVKQSMMLNAYRESLDDWREGAGLNRFWPGLVSMSATRGLYQQSFGWLTAGEMAAWMLPAIQTFMFVFIVAMIFLVFPLALLPGGVGYLSVWAKGLIWVNTWPIFYAVLNSFGEMILASTLGANGEGYGLSKLTQEDFSDTVIHSYAVVQFFCSMVPVLSWMLLSKSGYAFTQMVDRLAPSGVGAAIGSAAVDGNLNLDNVSTGNRTIAQQSVGGSLNRDAMVRDGGMQTQMSSDGNQTFLQDKSAMRVGVTASEQDMTSLNKSYENSQSLVESTSAAFNESSSATSAHAADLVSHFGKGVSLGEGWSESQTREVSEAHNIAQKVSSNLTKQQQENSSTRYGGEAGASYGTPEILKFLGGAKASVSASAGWSKEERDIYTTAQDMGWSEDHSQAIRNATNASKSGSLNISNDEGKKASESYNSSFANTEQLSKAHSSALSQQQKVSDLMSKVNTSGGGVSQDLTDEWLESESINHHGGDKARAANWVQNNQSAAAENASSWISSKINSVEIPQTDLGGNYEKTAENIKSRAPTTLDDSAIKARQEASGVGSSARTNLAEKGVVHKELINKNVDKKLPKPILPKQPDGLSPRAAEFKTPRSLDVSTSGNEIKGQSPVFKEKTAGATSLERGPLVQKNETPLERAHRLRKERRN